MDPNNHIALLPNPASSKSIDMAHVIASHLTGRQLNFSFHSLVWPEKLEGFSSIWIIGGDGTLHYFLNRFPDCDLPLAIFPGGTGNDFHWHLYGAIPLGVQLARVLEGNLQSTDAGSCNGKVFINGLGIGFDGAICKDLSGRKKSPGKTSYLLSALKQIWKYRETPGSIMTANQEQRHHIFMLSLANGRRYGGGFQVAPTANVTDGLLNLVIVKKVSLLQRLLYLPVIERGSHLDLPVITHATGTQFNIVFDSELDAHLDGEYFSATEFIVRCLPGRYSFLV